MIREILLPLVSERFLREERYRQGHIRIINALPERCILGLHVPEMKAVAKRIAGSEEAREVIGGFEREHESDRFSLCYEETVVWGLTINAMKCGVGERLEMVRRFVPAIDNGMSLIDTTGVITYDNDAQKVIRSEAFFNSAYNPNAQEEKAKAILQSVYKDAGTR